MRAPDGPHRCRAALCELAAPAGRDELPQHPLRHPGPRSRHRDSAWSGLSHAARGCPSWPRPGVDHGVAVLGSPPPPRREACRHPRRLVAGAGKELRGPVGMILLLLTGRIATALPHMSGPGVQTIASKSGLRRRTRSERCGVNDCLRGLTPSQPRRFHRPQFKPHLLDASSSLRST